MESDIKYVFKRKGKTRICKKCGQVIQPGGMGGHMALAHGVRVKTVIQAPEARGPETREACETPEARGSEAREARETRDVKIQRPSDYVKKKSEVIETIEDPVIAQCEDCGKREKIERLTHIGLKKETSLLCYDCWNKRHLK
jgi:hypothetical protein